MNKPIKIQILYHCYTHSHHAIHVHLVLSVCLSARIMYYNAAMHACIESTHATT